MVKAPFWCMFADHAPMDKEADYDAHMLKVHGIDFNNGKSVIVPTRAWQCGDTAHAPYGSEQHFLEHLVMDHGLSDKVSTTSDTVDAKIVRITGAVN